MPMYRVKATVNRSEGLIPQGRPETYYVSAASATAAAQRIERHYDELKVTGYDVHTVEPCAPTDVPSVMPVVHAGGRS